VGRTSGAEKFRSSAKKDFFNSIGHKRKCRRLDGISVLPWSGELIFAMAWLVLVLSIAAVGLMYWLIRRSTATGFASLFYLVPAVTALFAYYLFGERLDALSTLGMIACAGGVLLANRDSAKSPQA